MDQHIELIQQHAQPMEPLVTAAVPRLPPVAGIRAVLFDVYGTLLISASGDVGTVASAPGDAFVAALGAAGLELTIAAEAGAATLVSVIHEFHEAARLRGIEFPEVEIVAVWRRTIEQLAARQAIVGPLESVDFTTLAIEYEVRVNPVWPMQGVEECLARLKVSELALGIVSNAQFFSPLLFPALLQQSLGELGFSPELCIFSYRHAQAKPGTFLYSQAKESLARRGIDPGEVLYIGNDMLNDIMPAQTLGFRTALFAGDRRSLRMRPDDPRVADVQPDLVITHWKQLAPTLGLNEMTNE